eukprot:gene49809-31302_t
MTDHLHHQLIPHPMEPAEEKHDAGGPAERRKGSDGRELTVLYD